MHKEKLFHFWNILAGQELWQVFIITVCAHSPDACNLCMDFMCHAVNIYFFPTRLQPCSQLMGLTVSSHQDAVAWVFYVVTDMVLDPAGIGHSTGWNDHAGLASEVEKLGLIYCFNEFQPSKIERVIVIFQYLPDTAIEVLRVFFHNLRGLHAEWTVHELVNFRQASFQFQLVQCV